MIGTPHPMFFATARWTHSSGKLYVEPYAEFAWKQVHLSSLDLGDRPRVLGAATSSSLFTEIPGWATFGGRIGFRSGLHEIVVDFENLGDRNYRGMSWGQDAPGRGISARYSIKF